MFRFDCIRSLVMLGFSISSSLINGIYTIVFVKSHLLLQIHQGYFKLFIMNSVVENLNNSTFLFTTIFL